MALNLKVLSPSSEIEGGIHLQDLPASTTVRELRLKIQDAVASKPGPERMRLIYRGKVVANDADTLETVFGANNVRGRAQTVICMWQRLTRAPAPRIQRPEPASSTPRTAPSPLDIVFARSTHRGRPAQSIPSCASTASCKSTADEPVPRHTTTPTKLAATSRATAAPPPPPPSAPSTCPPSPPCAAAARPARPNRCYPTPTPDAAADCTSIGPARRPSTYASCRYTNTDTAGRRSCAQACIDRRSSRASARRSSTCIRRASSTERQDGTARGNRAKWRPLVRHIQRLHGKHTATARTANHATTCSICCSTPPIWLARTRWSKCASELASTATSRNPAGSCS